jgi:hypothetical protein
MIEIFFRKFTSLEDSVIKDNKGFIKLAKVQETFNYLIDKNRVNTGFFILYEVEDKNSFEEKVKEIKLEGLILFKATPTSYGLLIPTTYEEIKSIKKQREIIKEFKNFFNEEIKFKATLIKFGIDTSE